jgi:glycosyltransferase involved in cell wall biosynthesis
MKIAHVVDSMEVGGAETLVRQMCRLQRKQGDDPRVYAIGNLGALGHLMQQEGFLVRSNVGVHLPDSALEFYRLFRQWRPDVVHLHNPTPTVYAALPARAAGIRSIVSTRHSLVAPPHRVIPEFKYALAARCCNWIVGICDATVDNLKSLHTLPESKIVRVYNGAESLRRMPKADCPAKNGFTLLYVGRLAQVKNHVLLLHAFRQALAMVPDLQLWMVGDGSERARLKTLTRELNISSQVIFWGEQLDVSPFFSSADVFIMSSRSEGLPMSLLQALSLGVPAIVTNVGGMAEVVRAAGAGYIVSLEDFGPMAAAIVQMATNGVLRERFSAAAATSFRNSFMLETMVSSYAEYYRARNRVT